MDPSREELDLLRGQLEQVRQLAADAKRRNGPRSAAGRLAHAVLAALDEVGPPLRYRPREHRDGHRVFWGDEEIGWVQPVRRPGRPWGSRPDGYFAWDMTGRVVPNSHAGSRAGSADALLAAHRRRPGVT